MSEQQFFPEWKAFLGEEGSSGPVRQVAKRSGEVQRYDRAKIAAAIGKAFDAVLLRGAEAEAAPARAARVEAVVASVESRLRELMAARHPNSIPAIEEIQDLAEDCLIAAGEARAAKAYILYRAKHEAMRDAARLTL
ncbi:MAG TPA: ATP cone domain-containing protein, partial [Spirochaetales bacterium]|nr:ATP cone domain-containing protein [Spirochaetales bacterium]